MLVQAHSLHTPTGVLSVRTCKSSEVPQNEVGLRFQTESLRWDRTRMPGPHPILPLSPLCPSCFSVDLVGMQYGSTEDRSLLLVFRALPQCRGSSLFVQTLVEIQTIAEVFATVSAGLNLWLYCAWLDSKPLPHVCKNGMLTHGYLSLATRTCMLCEIVHASTCRDAINQEMASTASMSHSKISVHVS